MTGLNAVMVSVDYEDLLAVTLPYNRHHFDQVLVVTDREHHAAVYNVASKYDALVYATDEFYARGAAFNKWAALEHALDECFYRHGWLCLMDADVLWPKAVRVAEYGQSLYFRWDRGDLLLNRGELMSPLRRMAPWPITGVAGDGRTEMTFGLIPAEKDWGAYPIHRNIGEWAGYSQVFHCSDPHLPAPPWHETDWVHAGGADSLFQRHWPMTAKRRPAWECLHLGEAGANWYGRATRRADGSEPEELAKRHGQVREIWANRHRIRAAGGDERARFAREKLSEG